MLSDEQARNKIVESSSFYRRLIANDVLQLIVDGLKTEEGLPYLTDRANSIFKDLLGYNRNSEALTNIDISMRDNVTLGSVNETIRRNTDHLCARMRFVHLLSESDPCLGVDLIYRATVCLSNKTINSLIRSNVVNISDFMCIDKYSVGRVWHLGPLGLEEVIKAQDMINNPDLIVDEEINIAPSAEDLQKKRLLQLELTKMELLEKLNSVVSEIEEINNNQKLVYKKK